MEVERIAGAAVERRDHVRLPFIHEADMAEESSIQNRVDGFRVVRPALGMAPDFRAFGRRHGGPWSLANRCSTVSGIKIRRDGSSKDEIMSENDLRRELDDLTRRLEGAREWPELRAIYLDIAPLIGRLGAVVREAERQVGTEGSNAARASLEEAKATARQV